MTQQSALWLTLIGYGVLMWLIAPATSAAAAFVGGKDRKGREPGVAMIAASIVVAWIFSKSMTNAANLGRTFGVMGGLGYAVYYLGIPICGLLILRIRRVTGATSLAGYIRGAFGPAAASVFFAIVLVRLFNEIWSNTAVVGAYFGARGTGAFIASALAFTGLVLLYTLKGGMRATLVTDGLEFALLVAAVLFTVAWATPQAAHLSFGPAEPGFWNSGVDFMLVALLQCVAYPFHDPVLTDRAFLADARTTRRAYFIGGAAAGGIIVLFSVVGVAARGVGGDPKVDAPAQVAAAGGMVVLTTMAAVMLLSGGSTIDSTFSSTARAVALDLGASRRPVLWGRIAMVTMAIVGNLPMLFGADLLKATTVSGTMVLGLAPAFCFPAPRRRPAAMFLVPVTLSILGGVLSTFPPNWAPLAIGTGPYAKLLGWNVATTIACWAAFGVVWAVEASRARPPVLQSV